MQKRILIILLALLPTLSLAQPRIEVTRHAVIRDGPRGAAGAVMRVDSGIFTLVADETTNNWYNIWLADGNDGWIYSRSVQVLEADEGASSITVASFNTLHLGWNNGKDLAALAAVIANYDLIAVQEVMREPPVEDLLAEIEATTDANWEWIHCDQIGRSTYRERYGFAWRTDRVAFVHGSQYVVEDPADVFAREPFVASFVAGEFDFTIISVHSTYGDTIAERRDEARQLARVFADVQAVEANEDDILLVGDFNLRASDAAWNDLQGITSMTHLIPATTLTSLGNAGPVSAYDNIWLQNDHVAEYADQSGAYDFALDMFDGDYTHARSVVSDHIPVWAEFRTDGPDDD